MMKLTISNIAWEPDEDKAVTALMKKFGATGVEIAPTKIWADPASASDSDIKSYAARWKKEGIEICSMQALLFGRPELTIFENKDKRQQTIAYLRKIIRLGGMLGASALVFGSPKNRLEGHLDAAAVTDCATEFFTAVGKYAMDHDCTFCIEPNPVAYDCDFITTSEQARALVNMVNHPGFGLHLDAAGMTMSNENIADQLPLSIAKLCHFHISEPNLEQVGTGGVDHELIASLFGSSDYGNWYSIEMRAAGDGTNVAGVASALKFVRETYQTKSPIDSQ